MTERWPGRARIALAGAGALPVAALVDYQLTSDALPELGPSATADDPAFGERERGRSRGSSPRASPIC